MRVLRRFTSSEVTNLCSQRTALTEASWAASSIGRDVADDRPKGFLSGLLFQLLGAAAGLVVLMTLLGGVASWARYKTLDLPNNAAIATLSQTTLLIAGVNELALPIGIGLLTAIATLIVRRYLRVVPVPAVGLYVVLVLYATALVWIFWSHDYAVYVCATALLVFLAVTPLSTSAVAFTAFFAMVGIGTIVAAREVIVPPTHLERAELIFQNGHRLYGFWINTTSDTIYLAPQLGGRNGPCQVSGYIVGFRSSRIQRIRLEQSVKVFPLDSTHDMPCPKSRLPLLP